MNKQFALAEVKAVDGKSPTGEFEAILSAPTLDRDNEVIDTGAFEPLPASVPVHAYHDFRDPIGRGVPFYDDGVLKLRGAFASTTRAQEIRTLVAEGVIASMSVGFMGAKTDEDDDGIRHITKAEILEGSFVSIPSNREAAVLAAKEYADQAHQDPPSTSPDTDPEATGSDAGADEAPADDPVDAPAEVDDDDNAVRAQAAQLPALVALSVPTT
jgi:HK97 family phage prohead protease